jgi:uncharacterized protein YigE (DUF2233 family)
MLLLVACGDEGSPPRISSLVTLYPNASAAQSANDPATTVTPDPLALYDGEWKTIKPGLEYMALRGRVLSGADQVEELLLIARVDPKRIQLQVRYTPDAPQRVRTWLEVTQADLVINGGFFDEQNAATALVIVDGVATGKSYSGFGGLFALRDDTPSTPTLQWLKAKPYTPDPRITYALQGSPMLVHNGGMVQGISDNGARSRRSFVAIDTQGRVLFGIGQYAQWTLTDLARYLAEVDALQIQNALNLDGGGSTGLWIRGTPESLLTDSFDGVPMVVVGIGN